MSRRLEYDEVAQYLRTFSADAPRYDFAGLLHLVLAGIENLRKNVTDGDILEHAHRITGEQADFLRQLVEGRAESTEFFINEISHTSQTGLL